MTAQPAQAVLAGLDIAMDLHDGDLVANAVILAKVVGHDGQVGVVIAASEGTSWLDQLGLVTAATQIIGSSEITNTDDD